MTTTYFLTGDEDASLRIYDRSGNLVRVLLRGTMPGGTNRMPWDGRDLAGNRVPAGLYWMTLTEIGLLSRVQLIFRQECRVHRSADRDSGSVRVRRVRRECGIMGA